MKVGINHIARMECHTKNTVPSDSDFFELLQYIRDIATDIVTIYPIWDRPDICAVGVNKINTEKNKNKNTEKSGKPALSKLLQIPIDLGEYPKSCIYKYSSFSYIQHTLTAQLKKLDRMRIAAIFLRLQ